MRARPDHAPPREPQQGNEAVAGDLLQRGGFASLRFRPPSSQPHVFQNGDGYHRPELEAAAFEERARVGAPRGGAHAEFR